MKVKDICTRPFAYCGPHSTLASVGWLMHAHDCGIIPVLGADGRPVGVITDRDIALAIGRFCATAAEIPACEVMSSPAQTCSLEADIHDALAEMQNFHVHRLLVTGEDGRAEGILSLTDIALVADGPLGDEECSISPREVLRTLKALSERHPILGTSLREPVDVPDGC